MSDDELMAIEERAKAATPGPWRTWTNGFDGGIVHGINEDSIRPYAQMIFGGEPCEGFIAPDDPDAIFAAAAREDIPLLIEDVRRLRRWNKSLYETIFTLERELAIHRIAAEPLAVAMARKSAELSPLERPSFEIEHPKPEMHR